MPRALQKYDGEGLVLMTLPTEAAAAGMAKDSRFRLEWCSCDEGLNTFITITDLNTGVVYTVGEDLYKKELFPLLRRADELKGRAARWLAGGDSIRPRTVNAHEYVVIRNAMLWCNQQARAVADKIHSAAIRLLSAFNLVILARLPVSQMVQRSKSSARTNRGLLALRFGRFHTKLMRRAAFLGIDRMRILDGIEPHTSHACCGCGRLFGSLGYSRVFQCANEECVLGRHASSGRDSNASRGIGLLNLGLLALQLFGKDTFASPASSPSVDRPFPIVGLVEGFGQLTRSQLVQRADFYLGLNRDGLVVHKLPDSNLSLFSSIAAQLEEGTSDADVRVAIFGYMRTNEIFRGKMSRFLTERTSYIGV